MCNWIRFVAFRCNFWWSGTISLNFVILLIWCDFVWFGVILCDQVCFFVIGCHLMQVGGRHKPPYHKTIYYNFKKSRCKILNRLPVITEKFEKLRFEKNVFEIFGTPLLHSLSVGMRPEHINEFQKLVIFFAQIRLFNFWKLTLNDLQDTWI